MVVILYKWSLSFC